MRRAVTLWQNGKPTVLSDQYLPDESWIEGSPSPTKGWAATRDGTVSIIPSTALLTPDGKIWRTGLRDCLYRLDKSGRWVEAGTCKDALGLSRPIRPVSADGPPWLMLQGSDWWRFSYDSAGRAILEQVQITMDVEDAGFIRAALPLPDGQLMVSTDKNLLTVDPCTLKATKSALLRPGQKVGAMAHDGLGRLWLAGDGLWMVEPGGPKVHALDLGPALGRIYFTAMARDPDRPDAVLCACDLGLIRVSAGAAMAKK
jgi:hypothetical protein